MKHWVAGGMTLMVCLFLEAVCALFFASMPQVMRDPTAIGSIVTHLIQKPPHTLHLAWTQLPFRYGQGMLALLMGILYIRMIKGKRSYEAAHEHGAQGTARWATKKEAFDPRYFFKKIPDSYLMQDVERSFELAAQAKKGQHQMEAGGKYGQREIDEETFKTVRERLLRQKDVEENRIKKIKKVAEEQPEGERQDYLQRELGLMDRYSLTVYENGKYRRHLLKDLQKNELDPLIPFSLTYFREIEKKMMQELAPRAGTILGIVEGAPLIQPMDSKLGNRNVLVVGGSGSAKTQSFVFPNVLHQTQASLCISDPKGEIFAGTATIKEKQGYQVRVMNFIDMLSSNRWNPLDYVRSELDATMVANAIVGSKNPAEKKDIWYHGQLTLLRSLILYAVHEFEPGDRNLGGILDFMRVFTDHYSEEEEGTALDRIFESLDYRHPARMSYELGYKQAIGRTRSGIMISMLTTVGDFVSSYVQHLTKQSDFVLSSLGHERVALYLIIDADDDTFEGLVNLFIRQLFKELKRLGEENQSKLYTPVSFLLDEFANLGKIPNFSRFLSTCRGYGINVVPVIQNISQLHKIYGEKETDSIEGNCSTKILLKASDPKTQKHFSEMLGHTTVRVSTRSENKSGFGGSFGRSETYMKRPLLDHNEIQRVEHEGSIIITDNTYPIRAKKAFQSNYFVDKEGQLIQQLAGNIQTYAFEEDLEMKLMRAYRKQEYQSQGSSLEQQKQKAEKLHEREEQAKRKELEREKQRAKEERQKELVDQSRRYFEEGG